MGVWQWEFPCWGKLTSRLKETPRLSEWAGPWRPVEVEDLKKTSPAKYREILGHNLFPSARELWLQIIFLLSKTTNWGIQLKLYRSDLKTTRQTFWNGSVKAIHKLWQDYCCWLLTNSTPSNLCHSGQSQNVVFGFFGYETDAFHSA